MSATTKETLIIVTLFVVGYFVVQSINKAAVTAGNTAYNDGQQGVSNAVGTVVNLAEALVESLL